jgi:Anti-sigma factor NepR
MSWAARGWQMNIRKLSRQNQSMKLQGSEMKPVAKLGNDVKAKIGQQLRLMYDEIVEQGVPERFAVILRDLDEPTDEGSENEPT